MTEVYAYRKSEQLKRHIGQFMRVFAGFQVQDGVARDGNLLTKRVPVVYGNMSRITASILSKRDFLANSTLPIMAANLVGIQPDIENRRTQHHIEERTIRTSSGMAVLERITGPAYLMNMELSIYASSTTELFELFEQIVLIFNPRVTIQTSSDKYDPDYISEIAMTGVQPEIAYPLGTDQRVVMMTLQFEMPFRFKYPKGFNDNIIETIIGNVKAGEANVQLEEIVLAGDVLTGEIEVTRT